MRQVLALITGACASTFTASVLTLLITSIDSPTLNGGHVVDTVWLTLIFYFIFSILVGLPVALVLIQKKMFRMVPMAVAGAIAGVVPATLLGWPGLDSSSLSVWDNLLLLVSCGGAVGAIAGAVFYQACRLMSPGTART